jgi:PAS domain S-box-containing protein
MPLKTIKTKPRKEKPGSSLVRRPAARSHKPTLPLLKEEFLAMAFRLSPHPIGITELETGCCLEVNDACLEIFGFRRDEVIGRTTLMLGIWPDPEERARLIERVQAERSVRDVEVTMRTKNGGLRRFLISTELVKLGKKRCLLTIGHDITERTQVEEALRRKSQLLDLSFEPTFVWDLDRGITEWNRGCEHLYGYSRREALGQVSHQLLQTRFPVSPAEAKQALLTKGIWMGELRHVTRDGREVIVESRWQLIIADERRIVLEANRDITERKQAEQELRGLNATLEHRVVERTAALNNSEQQLRADLKVMTVLNELGRLSSIEDRLPPVLEQIVDAAIAAVRSDFGNIQLLDPESGHLKIVAQRGFPDWWVKFWNEVPKGQGACGTALQRAQRVIIDDVKQSPIYTDEAARDTLLQVGVCSVVSTPLVDRSGKLIGMLSTHYKTPIQINKHALARLDLLARQVGDFIERVQTQTALRESEERFRAFLDHAPNLAFIKALDGRYLYANRPFQEAFGLDQKSLVGKTDTELFPREQADQFQSNDRRVLESGEAMKFEEIALYANRPHTSIVVKFPVRDGAGRIYATGGIVTDITDRKKAEEELRQSQEELRQHRAQLQDLASKLITTQEQERQRIARDLHDDFSQRIAALVLDFATIEQRPPLPPERLADRLRPVRERLEQLSDDIHNLAYKLHPSLLEHAGLQPAIEDQIHEITKRTGLSVSLKVNHVPSSLSLGYSTGLFRVLQESLQNVVKHAKATEVTVRLTGSSKGVGLSVMDNGKGFDLGEGILHQKGLGLISMQERLRLLGGFLRIHARPGDGTKVCAWIPMKDTAI